MPLVSRAVAVLSCLAGLAAQDHRAPLRGVVVDPDGNPVPGAAVEAWRREGQGLHLLDLDYSDTQVRVGRTPTDRTGAFALQLPVGQPCELRIDHPPHARWFRAHVLPGEELRVELQRPAVFEGRVAIAGTGLGANATLRAFDPGALRLPLGRTDDQGRFRCERLPAGTFTIEVIPDAAQTPSWQRLTFVPGATTEWNFEVEPGVVLTGCVVDAATGAPIEGAVVGEGWTLHKGVRTDREGRYRLLGFGGKGRAEVFCRANGYGGSVVLRPDPLRDPTVIDFALERGGGARGQLVDAEGKPVQGVYVALIGMSGPGQPSFHDWAAGRTAADGTFRLQGLREDLQGTLLVRGSGFATLVFQLPRPDGRGVVDVGRLALQPGRVVHGTIVDADGKPIPRARIELHGTNADRWRLAPQAGESRGLDMYVATRNVQADDYGVFAFGDVADGEYRLVWAPRAGQSRATIGIKVGADAPAVEFRIPR